MANVFGAGVYVITLLSTLVTTGGFSTFGGGGSGLVCITFSFIVGFFGVGGGFTTGGLGYSLVCTTFSFFFITFILLGFGGGFVWFVFVFSFGGNGSVCTMIS